MISAVGTKHVVGVADMKVSACPEDVIVTHALGSCLGISAHDSSVPVGGLLHVMLPTSAVNPEKAAANPYMFVDTALPPFFHTLYKLGATKRNLVIKVAGGANIHGVTKDTFAIGKRNIIVVKKMFWRNNVLIEAQDVGGSHARTMYLEIGTGKVTLSTAGEAMEL